MLIRVPNFFRKPKAARCEIRCPDPSSNPYLVFAVLMAAGYEGVKNQLQAPAPVELNVFHLDKTEQARLGVDNMPRDFGEALEVMSKSDFVKEVMGETAFNNYIDLKEEEFKLYSAQVSPWELKRYTPIL
jgi:glutamine synthetase